MKIEIINKPMLCWDNDETLAKEWHVLAKVTKCAAHYPFKVIANENTPYLGGRGARGSLLEDFTNAKPLTPTVEMTVAEISKVLGKTIKIIE